MTEPQTKAEMVANWKAARGRMAAAGVAQEHSERERNDSTKCLRVEAFVKRLHEKADVQAVQRREQERIIANALDERCSVEAIVRLVAHVHRMSVAELKGPRRARKYVDARFHAVHLLATLRPDLSMPFIGRALGGRDHSTVIHARKQWPGRVAACRREIEEAERLLPHA